MDDQTLHHFMQDLAPIVIGVALIFASAWVVGNLVATYREKSSLQTRTDFYNRLLDKFGSASEFVAYLQSETGGKFFEELPVQSAAPTNKILVSIQRGVVLLLVGAGLVFLANIWDNTLGGDLFIVLAIFGTVSLMLGIGYLISTGISYYLSKKWGLLTTIEEKPRQTKSPDESQSASR